MSHAHAHADDHDHDHDRESTRILQPILWGLVAGVIQSAAPLAIRWLEPTTVQAVCLAFVAAVYVGFAVADGRPRVLLVEATVAAAFLVLGLVGVTASGWVLVAAYLLHGVKDLRQHRTRYVAGTRWWPPFCAAVDFVVAAVLAVGLSDLGAS